MAAPTATYAWDPATLVITATCSEDCTRGSEYSKSKITYTDAIGRGFKNTSAIPIGEESDTLFFQCERDDTVATTAETLDVAAGTFANLGDEDNEAVVAAALYGPVTEASTGLTRSDVEVLEAQIAKILAGTMDPTLSPQTDNLAAISTGSRLLVALRKAPKIEDRAWQLIDAHEKFRQSAKNVDDFRRLEAAIYDLQNALNPRGTTAMLANGT